MCHLKDTLTHIKYIHHTYIFCWDRTICIHRFSFLMDKMCLLYLYSIYIFIYFIKIIWLTRKRKGKRKKTDCNGSGNQYNLSTSSSLLWTESKCIVWVYVENKNATTSNDNIINIFALTMCGKVWLVAFDVRIESTFFNNSK